MPRVNNVKHMSITTSPLPFVPLRIIIIKSTPPTSKIATNHIPLFGLWERPI
jgi:hypothetical protein